MKSAIQRRLDHEHKMLASSISGDLKTLRQNIDRALTALTAGDRLDAHLISNAVMLTEQIARWNLVRDLVPMAADEAPPEYGRADNPKDKPGHLNKHGGAYICGPCSSGNHLGVNHGGTQHALCQCSCNGVHDSRGAIP